LEHCHFLNPEADGLRRLGFLKAPEFTGLNPIKQPAHLFDGTQLANSRTKRN